MYTGWQILGYCLMSFLWCWSCNDWVNQPNKLHATVSQLFYLTLKIRLNKISAQCIFIVFVWTAMLDSQPMTISLVMDIWCNKVLHRMTLAWFLRDQFDMFYNLCLRTTESKVHEMLWFRSNRHIFFWNQFKILVPVEIAPLKLKLPPNLAYHKIATWGTILPTFKNTALEESTNWALLSSFCDDSNLRISVFK